MACRRLSAGVYGSSTTRCGQLMSATMAFVAYRYDEQARQEAADHPVDEGDAGWLREQCTRKTAELGDGGVRGHTVSFSVTAWDQPPGLPDSVAGTGHISHGEVLDIGERVRTGTLLATELIAASFAWGCGTAGYGPRRYRDIRAAAGDQLDLSLKHALAEINKDPGSPDPVAGYCLRQVVSKITARRLPGSDREGRVRSGRP